jgi:alpha-tubulin suppressor-like RCC1 family protein
MGQKWWQVAAFASAGKISRSKVSAGIAAAGIAAAGIIVAGTVPDGPSAGAATLLQATSRPALATTSTTFADTTSTTFADTTSTTSAGRQVYSFGVVGGDGKIRQLERQVPTPVAGLPANVVQVASSNSDSYVRTAGGTVWAWGAGGYGELGDGTTPRFVAKPVEVRFPAGVRISSLANPMPFNSGLAIDSQGRAWGWGYNPMHALCLSGGEALLPRRLPLAGVHLASGAGDHSLLAVAGQVYACGLGEAGELGDGSTVDRSAPTPVVGLPAIGVKALTSSWQGSGALMDDGTYYDWGYNRQGQLGNGNTTDADVPVPVVLPAPVSQVSQGGSNSLNGQTLALLVDGSVWAWGAGCLGQLGDGTSKGSVVPVPVSIPTGVQFALVCSGGDTSYAIDSSRNVWVWGGNGFGQLGNDTSGKPRSTPEPVSLTLSQVSATATNVVGLGNR